MIESMMMRMPSGKIVMQIYVRSYQDTNRDGVGDLPGITARLDYLQGLGVDFIWITPFYPSPMKDFGYDVADYTGIHPMFGHSRDFETLVAEARKRNIGIVIDVVFNHTSDLHAWFVESKSSRDSLKRDWYIWRDPAPDGGPPNNWISVFGGSAWTFDAESGQYYLHSFLKEQPDLNWENPEVQEAIREVLRFWFELGVMGVRVDAIDWAAKDVWEFKDDPINPAYDSDIDHDPYHEHLHVYSMRMPHLKRYLRVLDGVAQEFEDRFVLTETYPPSEEDSGAAYRATFDQYVAGLSAPFVFGLMRLARFTAANVKGFVDSIQAMLRADESPVYVLGNHDSSRLASRIGAMAARLIALMQLTLPGVVVIYAGDELGLIDGLIGPDEVQDPAAKQDPTLGRDPERTPMPWTRWRFRGFSKVKPWLPFTQPSWMNVKSESADAQSMLNFYKRLIKLRRKEAALRHGCYEALDLGHRDVFGFTREHQGRRFAVLLNFSDVPVKFTTQLGRGSMIVSTAPSKTLRQVDLGEVQLQSWEGRLIQLD
jgi:alpha-glucosidase